MIEPHRRRQQRGWYFYDWANSAFSTTVGTVFLGPYLTSLANDAADAGQPVTLLGLFSVAPGAYIAVVISLSVLLQVITMPIVGAIADNARSKKRVLAVTAYLGSAATMGLFLVTDSYQLGGALFIIANVAFGCSVVVYNSFLPDIATPDERNAVSSRGWALGYVGGIVLLVLNLVLFLGHSTFGISESLAVRISLFSAGLWWGVFTIIPLVLLREQARKHHAARNEVTSVQ